MERGAARQMLIIFSCFQNNFYSGLKKPCLETEKKNATGM
jgi:hypothetical protein